MLASAFDLLVSFEFPVYLQGDAFEFGWYDGVHLANKHNVVIVAANYRVGPFGFLALDELRREDAHNSTGNMGLLDQRAALQWRRAAVDARQRAVLRRQPQQRDNLWRISWRL